jgi:hypothetical protein
LAFVDVHWILDLTYSILFTKTATALHLHLSLICHLSNIMTEWDWMVFILPQCTYLPTILHLPSVTHLPSIPPPSVK